MSIPGRQVTHDRVTQGRLRGIAVRQERAPDPLPLDERDGAPVGELGNRDLDQGLGDLFVFHHPGQRAQLGQQVQARLGQLAVVNVADHERDGADGPVGPVDGTEAAFLRAAPGGGFERFVPARQRQQVLHRPADHQLGGDAQLGGRAADDLAARNAECAAKALERGQVAVKDSPVRSEQGGAVLDVVEQGAQPLVLLAQAGALRRADPFPDDGRLGRRCFELLLFELLDEVPAQQLAFPQFQRAIAGWRARLR